MGWRWGDGKDLISSLLCIGDTHKCWARSSRLIEPNSAVSYNECLSLVAVLFLSHPRFLHVASLENRSF